MSGTTITLRYEDEDGAHLVTLHVDHDRLIETAAYVERDHIGHRRYAYGAIEISAEAVPSPREDT
jgi:hypothetical protein